MNKNNSLTTLIQQNSLLAKLLIENGVITCFVMMMRFKWSKRKQKKVKL